MVSKPVSVDVAKLAVRISENEGLFAVQAQEMRSAIHNVSNTLAAVQSEIRDTSKTLHALAIQLATNEKDREAIGRLEGSMIEINRRLEAWFDDNEKTNSNRWQVHERLTEEKSIKIAHEVGAIQSETFKRVTDLEKGASTWRGAFTAFVLLSSTLISGFVWVVNTRLQTNDAQILVQDKAIEANRIRIETLKDKQHNIEIFLAQRNRRTPEPNQEEGGPQ